LFHRFTEGDAGVFDGVVLVDVEVATRDEIEVESAVPRDLLEHVVEEANAGVDARLAAPIKIQLQAHVGFLSFAMQ
jgi:hypothetical protein